MSRFIGNVSAYAYAVSKGYTGTEEEFAELMADYAAVGQRAENAAENALNSKTAAQTAATTATNKASEATTAAQTATTKAGEAQTSAQTASSKASEASQSASTASQKATEASQSATNAGQSAQTAEQAKTGAQTAQGLAESARDSAISAKNDAESVRDEAQEIVDGINAKAEQIDTNTADIAELESTKADLSELYKAFVTDTASGAIASFTDGADNLPLKSLVVNIDPVQDTSSGDPSPENICPIIGWTQVDVNHSDADMTNPTTITISLGQTVYGGTLDVTNGVLTVDRTYIKYDGSADEIWYTYANTGFRVPKTDIGQSGNGICNLAPTVSLASSYGVMFSANAKYIYFFQAASRWGVSTVADLRTWLAANNIEVCYELAEPIEIQLDSHTLNSLYGVNNLWADSGDTMAEYRADTKLYIERLTAPDSADMIADANITSGQYFMVGNSLYKATANIANGGQIIVGTNATRVSLAQALNEINA